MNAARNPPNPRDPLNPGAKILPRSVWYQPPHHRWTFRHMREMTPTASVRRGPGAIRPFDPAPQDLGGLAFKTEKGRTTLAKWLDQSFTDAFLVLHRGRVVHESYHNGMRPHDLHLSMSMAKSILGITTGILANAGHIDLAAPVTEYLPELAPTAYRGATVQNLLDMTSGVAFDESYDVPGSHMQKLGQAVAWGEGTRPKGWPQNVWQLVLELTEAERPHGPLFRYRSIESDVLGFVVERASGQPLAELVSGLIWQKIGAEEDACYTVDHGGFALADGGFNATLRDFARFGLMVKDGGRAGDTRIVPESWIDESRFGSGGRFEGIYAEVLPGGGYHNKWWQVDRDRGVIIALGIYGQNIYIDRQSDLVCVKLSTWPGPLDAARTRAAVAAYKAIGQALAAS